MLGACRDGVGVGPERAHHRVAGLEGVAAEFGHAEIGGFPGYGDIGDEEADLRGKDGEAGRLGIDDEIGLGQCARGDARGMRLDAGRDAAARLAAFLVAHESEVHVALEPYAGPIEQAERGKARADARLEVARAAPPDLAIDDGRAERILARIARPVLAPAIDMDGIGVADEEQPFAAAAALARAPDIGAAGQEIGSFHVGDAARLHLLGEIGDETGLVAGDALLPDGAAQQGDGVIGIECGPQLLGQGAHLSTSRMDTTLAGGREMRDSGASAPKSVLCKWPSPMAVAPTRAAWSPNSLASTATG